MAAPVSSAVHEQNGGNMFNSDSEFLEEPIRKRRRPNFSSEETTALVEAVAERSEILLSGKGGNITQYIRRRAWAEVAKDINLVSAVADRTIDEIRRKFKDYKLMCLRQDENFRKFKMDQIKNINHPKTPGGNVCKPLAPDPVQEKLLRIIRYRLAQRKRAQVECVNVGDCSPDDQPMAPEDRQPDPQGPNDHTSPTEEPHPAWIITNQGTTVQNGIPNLQDVDIHTIVKMEPRIELDQQPVTFTTGSLDIMKFEEIPEYVPDDIAPQLCVADHIIHPRQPLPEPAPTPAPTPAPAPTSASNIPPQPCRSDEQTDLLRELVSIQRERLNVDRLQLIETMTIRTSVQGFMDWLKEHMKSQAKK